MATPRLSRRDLMKLAAAGVVGHSSSGWIEALAQQTANNPQRRRACILLWMTGGPSQTDTFDMKPGHANGGEFRAVQTPVNGIRISEHLPKVGRNMRDVAIVRNMSSREGDHGRATFFLRTGYLPQGSIRYPTLGSLLSKELGENENPLPNFVSIAPYRLFNQAAYSSGFLGPRYAPLLVGDQRNFRAQDNYQENLRVEDLQRPEDVTQGQMSARVDLLRQMERDFVADHPGVSPLSHQAAYDRAVRLMTTRASSAFNLDDEPARLRDSYGRNTFGQGCLLARRLVERGVPFVEVSLGRFAGNALGWDTHNQNFPNVRNLCEILDPGFGTLIEDLRTRGLLDSTLIVWMGEFGRTPRINRNRGRDHFPAAWSTVMAGGGIRGGQAHGQTSADGMTVQGDPTTVPNFLATVCRALGINPSTQNMSNVGRPIRIVDHGARPIRELLR